MAVPINSASFSNMLDPSVGLRKVFFDSYDDYIKRKAMVPILFNMQGSTRQNEYALSVSALGDFEDFTANGQVVYDDISEGYKSTFTHNEWTKGIRFTRAAKDDDTFGIFDGLVKQRATAAARSRDKHGASIFNNAFTGTSGPDSLSLCNSSHTSTVNGVSVQSNTGTDTLNKTTVSSARLAMMKFYGFNGETIDAEGDTLLVPVDKDEDAVWINRHHNGFAQVASALGKPHGYTNQDLHRIADLNDCVDNFGVVKDLYCKAIKTQLALEEEESK